MKSKCSLPLFKSFKTAILTAGLVLLISSVFAGTVTVQFRTSTGAGISGVTPQYLVSGVWTSFTGATDGAGSVTQTFATNVNTFFRVLYEGGTYQWSGVNSALNPAINAYTTLVTVNLLHYDGTLNTTETGVAEYYSSGWINIGTTSGGYVSKELLPGSYPFHMIFHNFTQQISVAITGGTASGNNQTINFRTTQVTTSLMNHTGSTGISGGVGSYYSGAWYAIGTTDGTGTNVKIELLQGSYSFNMNYNNYTQQSAPISITDNGGTWQQAVPFQTTLVTTSLMEHTATTGLSGGLASYYTGGWYTLSTTDGTGTNVKIELLPGSYYFSMSYEHGVQQVGPTTVGTGPLQTIPFVTTLVSENIKDCSGALVSTTGGVAQYYSGGWWSFGTTTGGTVSKELIPASYYFNMNYRGVLPQQGPLTVSGSTQDIDFSTAKVTFPGASSASYSNTLAGTYTSFSPSTGIDLFPATYFFKINGATTGVSKTISGCSQSYTTAPCTPPSIEVTGSCTSKTLTAPAGNTYSWSPGAATTQSISVSSSGIYSVTVTYNFSCSGAVNPSIVYTTSVTMSAPYPIVSSAGSNGGISPTGTTNVCPATTQVYSITPAAGYHIANVVVDGSSTGTSSTYTFSSVGAPHTISASFAPDCTAPSITSDATITSLTCFDGSNGAITTYSEGSTPLTYSWSNGATTSGLSGVVAGTYTYTVTNGCGSVSDTVVVTGPDALSASSSVTSPVLCHGGNTTVTVSASGGTSPYDTYTGTEYGTHSVTAGSYTYTVYDANGCSATTSVTVGESDALSASSSVTSPVLCHGGNATVTVSASGGTSPYDTYTGTEYGTHSVTAGSYTYTVYDANGCSATTSVTVGEPDALSASSSVTSPVLCHGGNATVTVSASGGTSPYDTYTGTEYGPHSVTAGSYIYTVYDANGCSATTSVTVGEPDALSASSSVTSPVLCHGGNATVTVSASGGTSPYDTYTGTEYGTHSVTAGSYTYTVYDANGCSATTSVTVGEPDALSASSLVTSPVLCHGGNATVTVSASGGTSPYDTYTGTEYGTHSVTAGPYTYTVYDANGCSATTSVTAGEPDALSASSSVTSPILCHGGNATVTVSASGGTSPYDTYTGTEYGTHSVTAGSYTYTVYDANGCSATTSVTVGEPDALSASSSVTSPVLCHGGNATVTVSASGGTSPYDTYTGTEYGTHSVTAGSYTYTVYDANGCSATTSVTVGEPDALSASSSVTSPVLCHGGNATVTVSASGGTSPYDTYTGTEYGTHSVTAGSYTYTVYDANGCSATTSVTVGEPDALSASSSVTSPVLCHGGNATVTVSASGGTSPYDTYTGTEYGTHSVTAGSYTYTVYDANGCSATTSVTVGEPDALSASSSVTSPVLCHGGNATVTVSASGGTSPYDTYTGTEYGPHSVTAGSYTYTVSDANGCAATTSVTVGEPDALSASSSVTSPVLCHGGNATVTVSASGGTSPYDTYTGTEYGTHSVTAGPYTYTVYDANGCSATTSVTVGEPDALSAASSVTSSVLCHGGNATVTVSASGGTSPYDTYTGTEYGTHSVTAGSYTYTVYDANGCAATTSVTTGEPDALSASSSVTSPVLCHGGNATVTVSASGGTSPYDTYTGTEYGTHSVTAGSYIYTVYDANGCAATTSVTTGEPDALSASSSVTSPVLCHGGNATVTVSASGGTSPYDTYTGTEYGTHSVTAGSYTYTVYDANGCSATTSVTVGEPDALSASSSVTSPVLCHSGNATVTVSASGGTSPYDTYTGTEYGTHSVTAGSYTYTVYDANGCSATTSVTAGEPDALSASSSVTSPVLCHGGNATVTVSASGGTSPYDTYTGTEYGTHSVTAGSYTYTVYDANGCSATTSVTVGEPDALSASSSVTSPVLCHGGNATVTVSASGGTSPYDTYTGTEYGTHSVTAGSYTYTVYDANGCSATTSVTVGEPDALSASSSVTSPVLCHGGNATVMVSASGGTSPYDTYTGTEYGTHSVTAGSYTYTVYDANGCSATTSVTVGEPDALIIASVTPANISCNNSNGDPVHGHSDGSIGTSVTGGTTPYTYLWSNGQTGSTATGLTAIATYSVTITDANGCTATGAATVNQPAVLTTTAHIDHVNCNGGFDGHIDVDASGGTPGYFYFWTTGGSGLPLFDDLYFASVGTYTVTAVDAHFCVATASYTVSEPAALNVTAITANVNCFGGNDGSITTTVTGGTGTYHYNWSNGAHTANLTGLSAGLYILVVYDDHGCIATGTYVITQPFPISAGATVTNVSCNGGSNGSITTSAGGGTSPYTYVWSTGAVTSGITGLPAGTYSVTITDAHLCTKTASFTITQPTAISVSGTVVNTTCYGGSNGSITTSVGGGTPGYTYLWSTGTTTTHLTGRAAGTYSVTVTDSKGCTKTESFTITQPPILAATVSVTNVSCNGGSNGSINLTVSGGTPGYTYLWSPGGATTANLTGKPAGTYNVTFTDSKGCTGYGSFPITQPAALAISAVVTHASCNGGNGDITTTISGGTPEYTYLWSTGATTASLTSRPAGTYTLTVTDAKGCTKTVSFTITQPSAISAGGTVTNVSCNGGSNGGVVTSVSGGTPGYTYLWSTGAATANLTSRPAGTYTLTVTDTKGCTKTASFTIAQPSAMSVGGAITNVTCNGSSNGGVTTTVSGGTPGYTYLWSTGATTANLASRPAGTYTLTVTDTKGCTKTTSFTITQPALLGITAVVTNASCYGCSNGNINTTVTGGTTAYSYTWSNGSHLADPVSLCAGTYSVTVTDAKGCTVKCSYTVTQPGKPRGKGNEGITTGIDEHTAGVAEEIKIYPNPTEGRLNVVIPVAYTQAEITITDISGMIVEKRAVQDNNGTPVIFDLGKVARGVYLIHVATAETSYSNKIVVR